MDKSNGYNAIAELYIKGRGQDQNAVGTSQVRRWAKSLPASGSVLDIGCGSGIPISKVFVDEGMMVFGIDASPNMANAFIQNLPNAMISCEPAEESLFFNRRFEAIISWGLLFLLSKQAQQIVLQKAAEGLKTGGKLLFTSPYQMASWLDAKTGRRSRSLGATRYKDLLFASGLTVIEEFDDEGQNHYFNAVKV